MNTNTAGNDNIKNEPHLLLAARLRAWRKTKGWPQKKIAADLGISKSAWNRWEQGNRFPSPAFILLLSQYLRLPICRFFYKNSDHCPFSPFAKLRGKKW